MASETNRLVTALQVPIDDIFLAKPGPAKKARKSRGRQA
jgi:hypothetical protein